MVNNTLTLGLGTAAIGRPQYINIRQEASKNFSLDAFRQKGIAILDHAYEKGIRYFDTAPGYGLAEQLLIDWLESKKYTDVEVATKWGYTYVANFDPDAKSHEIKEHSLQKLNEQWEQSKKLLPYLCAYQIHSATLETGVLENERVLDRLAALKAMYPIKIGLTTTGANQAEVITKALDIHIEGKQLFDLYQSTYNVFDQSLAASASELKEQNKLLVIKEALANGRVFSNTNYPHYQKNYAALQLLAEKYKVGIDAIALRFCMDSIKLFKVLSGATNTIHLEQNLSSLQFNLELEEIDLLRKAAIDPRQYWTERKMLGWQ